MAWVPPRTLPTMVLSPSVILRSAISRRETSSRPVTSSRCVRSPLATASASATAPLIGRVMLRVMNQPVSTDTSTALSARIAICSLAHRPSAVASATSLFIWPAWKSTILSTSAKYTSCRCAISPR